MTTIDLQVVESMILTALQNRQDVGKEELRDLVSKFAPAAGWTDPAIQEELCRRLEARLLIRLELGHIICESYTPWLEPRKAGIDPYFWSRYHGLLLSKGYPPAVIARLDQITDRILGLLENPEKPGNWLRRGLVVGHVQSGKTANYIGLINKAADAGYRLVILIAGIHNNLRRQTQERVDEGFVGKDSSLILRSSATRQDRLVGVGNRDQNRFPIVFTSSEHDFSSATAQALGLSLNSVSEPVVLVIKKNYRTLSNLVEWLQRHNTRGRGIIDDCPMLLIDDEADNASINTGVNGDPTRINALIRSLLKLFAKRCYLGYTATPFANIFINPETENEMVGEELFPRDFIVCLDAPTNYVGPTRLFSDPPDIDAVRAVQDYESILPLRHKPAILVGSLPESLCAAIRTFVLARAIRICRGQDRAHNSMLVNVSRFTAVQRQVRDLVHQYADVLSRSIRFNYRLPWGEACKNTDMAALYATWSEEFQGADVRWPEVLARLNDAAAPIVVVEVNSRSGAALLDYGAHSQHGLNVIAVGGLSLSRGLTLEGLVSSYVLRNSQMYDTLLQMGRWFGYRDGYADLCRIYLPTEAVGWYAHITEATEELRSEFARMEALRMTPKEFGLKVRAHPESLIITARNKMREAKEILWSVDLQGERVETAKLVDNATELENNRNALKRLIENLERHCRGVQNGSLENVEWHGIPRDVVCAFLAEFRSHPAHLPSQRDAIVQYCANAANATLATWDVVLASSSKVKVAQETIEIHGYKIGMQSRKTTREAVSPPALLVNGRKARVASRGLEKSGLTASEIKTAEEEFRSSNPSARNVSDRAYRVIRKQPLLMLHLLRLEIEQDKQLDVVNEVAAWGISFPRIVGEGERRLVSYKVNLVWWKEQHGDLLEEEDEDSDD